MARCLSTYGTNWSCLARFENIGPLRSKPTSSCSENILSGLTEFQVEVSQLFFSLPASDGFLLAGGGALLASGLSMRPTRDLDFFGEQGRANVGEMRRQFLVAASDNGWRCRVIQSSETFARIHLVGSEEVLVDIAIDVAARHSPVVTIVGPTFSSEELAGRKLLALYDRAEARDFVDVFVLCEKFGKDLILARAAEIEGSIEWSSLAEMMGAISRFSDEDLPIEQGRVLQLREFFERWASELG